MKNRLAVSELRYLFVFVVAFFMGFKTHATHIKAADLFAKVSPTDNRTIFFTLNVYCDKAKVDVSGTDLNDCDRRLANCATLSYGDGSSDKNHYSSVTTYLDNNTYFFVYNFQHTYPGDQRYTVGYFDENRNAGIANLGGGASVNLAFYIAMEINVEQGYNNNHTPQLSIPPIDIAQQYVKFIHNPGAYDVDGDSISYKPYTPQIFQGVFAPQYVDPNVVAGGTTEDGLASAYYSINSKTGDVVWNAPASPGLYNVAFIIEEWRTFGKSKVRLSYAIRDMQIEVKPGNNKPPVITVPNDVCIVPNQQYKANISVDDPEKNLSTLIPYGELFESTTLSNKATFPTVSKPIPTKFSKLLEWAPTCADIRKRPYQVFFKATDQVAAGSIPLTDIKSFFITVSGPSPKGLKAVADTNKIVLNWNPYSCPNTGAIMQIYRRVGCDSVKTTNCVTGAPNVNYILIGTVGIAETTFVDKTTKRGNVYSYVLAAKFQDGVGLSSLSYPSANFCVEFLLITPVITKVSYLGDDTIKIAWQRPLDLDTNKFKGPYKYILFKKRISDASYLSLKEFAPTPILVDSSYLDTAVVAGSNYSYFVGLYYFTKATNTPTSDSSEIAADVKLTATPITNGVRLTWQATTPWTNGIDTLYHRIWRKGINDVEYELIDSVAFNQSQSVYSYNDYTLYQNRPLTPCDTFSYFVTTAGSYQNIRVLPVVLYNNSFTAIGSIKIDSPPTVPFLQDITYDCQNFTQLPPYKNVLNWSKSSASQCLRITGYNVYYSSIDNKDAMQFIVTVDTSSNQSFSHTGLTSLAGCYTVTAIDNFGNESNKSNKVCVNNCRKYELPNVFTPDGSGVNDLFRPIPPSPLFVESVKFKVFNRWGAKVFEKSDDVYLNWDGSSLPDGVYFYTANVKYFSADEDEKPEEVKGWIQIIR